MNRIRVISFVLTGLLCAGVATAQPHEGDALAGVSSSGVLKLSPNGGGVDGSTVLLAPADGLLRGWTGNSPGFEGIEEPDPETDTYPFGEGAAIWLDVISLDPALQVYTPSFQPIPAGGSTFLGFGGGDVHVHVIWHINSQNAAFDPQRTYWRGTFQLRDSGATAYALSEPFTFHFTNVACTPGDVNEDALVNNFDIDAFVTVLTAPDAASAEERCAADANRDGAVNNFDIDAFVALVAGG